MKGSLVLYRILPLSVHLETRLRDSRTSVKHITHEGRRSGGSRRVDNVCNDSREGRSDSIGNDGARSRPGEDFNLSRCIDQNMPDISLAAS